MTPFPPPQPVTLAWGLGLSAVTLLGLGVRLVGLDAHSFWYDEAVTQRIIEKPVVEHFRGDARDNGNPPFYTIAARVWQQAVGAGDDRLRLLSVLCGTLTVPFLGLLGRRLTTPAVGLVAALVYAVSPLAVEFANEARTYALLQLLAVVNAWLFVRWLSDGGTGNWAGYAATMFLCWYSHYYAAFLPLAHLLVLLALPWDTRRWLAWGAAMVAAALIWVTWLPVFATQLGTAGNLTRLAETWKVQFLATPVSYAFGRTLAWRDSPKWVLAVAGIGTLAAFLIPALVGAVRAAAQRPVITLLLAWLLLPVLIPLVVAVTFKPVYSHRYAAVGLPAFAVLVAAGYAALRPGPRWVLAALAVGLTAVSLYRYATEPLKDDWRSATPAILVRHQPGELLVFDTAIEVVTFQHYAGPNLPAGAVGLETAPADGPILYGIRYKDGRRVDPVVRDCAAEIFAADRVCLVLCVPKRTRGEYEALFRAKGYAVTHAEAFHRIQVIWLTRDPTDSQPRPSR
jgi:mannosyltransferase